MRRNSKYSSTVVILNGPSPKIHKGVEAFLQLSSNSKDNLLPLITKELFSNLRGKDL
jgi:hypothetical protein